MASRRLLRLLATGLICVAAMPAIAAAQDKFATADANRDGRLGLAELTTYGKSKLSGFSDYKTLFEELDKDDDGQISKAEFANRQTVLRALLRRRSVEGSQNQMQGRAATSRDGLKVGEVAPTFKLKSLDGKSETDLASFKGKRPVVLIFGSYT